MQTERSHAICGAKTRSGAPCKNPPVTGRERCRMHGGSQPRGLARHNTTHGRYSKHLPTRLGERYEAALKDPDLLALRDEIAITDARIQELLEPEDASAVDWPAVQESIEQRRKLVETERKRLVDLQQMMTAEQAMTLLAAVEAVVRKHVDDRDTLANIAADIARLVAHGAR